MLPLLPRRAPHALPVILLALTALAPAVGRAQTDVTGKVVHALWHTPAVPGIPGVLPDIPAHDFDLGTGAVGPGTEFSPFGGEQTIDVAANTLTWRSVRASGAFFATGFNGPRVSDANAAIPAFTSFFLISASPSVIGFDASRLTFTDDELSVDLRGVNYTFGSQIVLGFTTAAPVATVPEPGTSALLGAGLVGVAGVLGRRRRREIA